ncbi:MULTISPECIES: hypothetical protein [unclassified Microbacterium]|uniref:hypothetical protein n=1 Tax=unclassified Microbacterium TaxID=2609290 RepID=UPI000CFE2978|nr:MULTISPECIES: hypothetical protein [unclassified Microbacterium]PQZ60215.1 hypothetical protein CQ032_05265 [Microbacterium sp. MYb43]PQZ76866.1 hypothetical protein CQ031_12015 [Microbacterium sp. MYb40]PRB23257.1 hypothetical protein CQ040_03865 [Microbacterium sp. MYb54]PRB28162.1 hypothetical protein CQ037_10205 [Microbacterium sp. MYb50]PRB66213.1 hypothetical protein CQ021_11910 [Microbacterium sp. MYb24]
MWQGRYTLDATQWGVGHGGFNSQAVNFQPLKRDATEKVGNPTSLRLIYDCGAGTGKNPRATLSGAIDRMVRTVPRGGTVDLLAISHFDMDHVNGLDLLAAALKDRSIGVTRVWAPILTPVEALFAVGELDVVADTGSTASTERDAFASLAADPEAVFVERFPGATLTRVSPSQDPVPPPRADVDSVVDGVNDAYDEATTFDSSGYIGLITAGGATRTQDPLWEVVPYATRSALEGSAQVRVIAEKVIGKPLSQCSSDDLRRLLNDTNLTKAFHAAVRKHHRTLPVKDRPSAARTGANLSTLCVYSGPVSPYRWARYRRGWKPLVVDPTSVPRAPGWLGTGDAGLLRPAHVQAMIDVLGTARLDRVGVSSAPHHGSRLDSNGTLWDVMPNLDLVTVEASHPHGSIGRIHPHVQVIQDLANRNIRVAIAIDNADSSWSDTGIR